MRSAAADPEGETKYGYDSAGRLNRIELPNGTVASVAYDSYSRVTAVTVTPAGGEAKTAGEGRCDRAVVSAGDSPGSLDVKARCFSPRLDGRGEIVISQSAGNGRLTPIVAYSRKLEISGGGRDHRGVGHCARLEMGVVLCEGPVHGWAMLHARLRVDPGTRCKREILVISNAELSCREGLCTRQVITYLLFRGRPRGC